MDRVNIRPPLTDDGPRLIRANRESRELHRPWVEPFLDDEGFSAWLARSGSDTTHGLVATETATGEPVGIINISNIVRGAFHSAYLGFYGTAPSAGRGLMTEAVGLAVRYAFDELGLHRLEANVQPGNTRSKALVQRLGFQLEGFSPRYLCIGGEWRDHERWAILADQANLILPIPLP